MTSVKILAQLGMNVHVHNESLITLVSLKKKGLDYSEYFHFRIVKKQRGFYLIYFFNIFFLSLSRHLLDGVHSIVIPIKKKKKKEKNRITNRKT